jgi:hypothetical protein
MMIHVKRPACALFALLLAGLFFMLANTAHAQQFQRLNGNNANFENGRWGVAPVVGAGYIACGTASVVRACGATNDVYAVQFGLNGAPVWANVYDIGPCSSEDVKSIIPLAGGGYVICGKTSKTVPGCSATPGAFLMKIGAGGAWMWTQVYPDVFAERVIEATLGNGVTTFAGDLIFCGVTALGGSQDAYLARVNNAGVMIWDASYGFAASSEAFHDVVEATVPGPNAGNIIAAGMGADTMGLLLRVDGNSGNFLVVPPQNVALYGDATYHLQFWSLQQLQVGVNAGNIVAVGQVTIAGFQAPDIYVVKTRPNPCIPIVDAIHGDLAGATDIGTGIREIVPTAGSALPAGNLIITGFTNQRAAAGFFDDAILLQLTPALAPAGLGYRAYGGIGNEQGRSVYPVYQVAAGVMPTDGYLFCGEATPSPAGSFLAAGDPGGMYIVKTTAGGLTPCFNAPIVDAPINPAVPVTCLLLPPVPRSHNCPTPSAGMAWPGTIQLCFAFPKENSPSETLSQTGVENMRPNPVASGNSFTIDCRLEQAGQASITLTDISGRVVATTVTDCAQGSNAILVNTEGLAGGTYMVTVTVGERSQTQRIVVVDGR